MTVLVVTNNDCVVAVVVVVVVVVVLAVVVVVVVIVAIITVATLTPTTTPVNNTHIITITPFTDALIRFLVPAQQTTNTTAAAFHDVGGSLTKHRAFGRPHPVGSGEG
jgi:hypothetical protein